VRPLDRGALEEWSELVIGLFGVLLLFWVSGS
jgi:hypothetical protein